MKKILLSLAGMFSASLIVNAQSDTLSDHFTSAPTIYLSDNSGYIPGNNGYGDIAKMQLFDSTYGVFQSGNITNVLLAIALKNDAGGSMSVKVWENNAGQPGAELGSVTFPLAQIDTAISAYQGGLGFIYNVNAQFNIPIPANRSFWAGIALPTTTGDTVSLFCTTNTMPSADSLTHSGEFWNDTTFHTMGDPGNWNFGVALAVFPVINGISSSLIEYTNNYMVYPNPAIESLHFQLEENVSEVSIKSLNGKIVSSKVINSKFGEINISELSSGMYLYEITTETGKILINNFVKK